MNGASLQLRRLGVSFGNRPVLDGLSLAVAAGELVALLGPSGCGKTTALRVVAGLLTPSEGEVLIAGVPQNGVPAEKRGAAMVFQNPLLFPHMSVAGNAGFGLKMRGIGPRQTAQRVAEALEMVQLPGFESRRPAELSGGQQQRVALARALITDPKVLLLDEPFSALDASLREDMRVLVRTLQRRLHITTLFVTHDQEEASAVADRIALMLDGTIVQQGPPADFYRRPLSPQVARFFGWQVLEVAGSVVAFRPESATFDDAGEPGGLRLEGTLAEVIHAGGRMRLRVRMPDGVPVRVDAPEGDFRVGGRVTVCVAPSRLVLFP